MRLPTRDAIEATRARVLGEHMPESLPVQTDTRAIERGATFLALRGERFDGHDFVEEAVARGAVCAIVDERAPRRRRVASGAPSSSCPTRCRHICTSAAWRARACAAPVVAVTGSTGKTTTKSSCSRCCAAPASRSTATPENENNEIGVAKLLFGLDDGDERVAIVEMGARKYRDLDVLVAAARPDVGVLTNVGEAHLEIMGSRERLAETKWAVPSGARRAVLNLDDAVSRARAESLAAPPMWYGIDAERPPHGQRARRDRTGRGVDDRRRRRHRDAPHRDRISGRPQPPQPRRRVRRGAAVRRAARSARRGGARRSRCRTAATRSSSSPTTCASSSTRTTPRCRARSRRSRRSAAKKRSGASRCSAAWRSSATMRRDARDDRRDRGDARRRRARRRRVRRRHRARRAARKGGAVVRYETNDEAIAWLRANVRRGDASCSKARASTRWSRSPKRSAPRCSHDPGRDPRERLARRPRRDPGAHAA